MIKPALTAEEWESSRYRTWAGASTAGDYERHALAALALYGQPFGFTWEDVALLREHAEIAIDDRMSLPDLRRWCVLLETLADRIEALLPES